MSTRSVPVALALALIMEAGSSEFGNIVEPRALVPGSLSHLVSKEKLDAEPGSLEVELDKQLSNQLAQWINFPNFPNFANFPNFFNCFGGNWRNC